MAKRALRRFALAAAFFLAAPGQPGTASGEMNLSISTEPKVLGTSSAYGVAAADFDLDGDVDLAFANFDTGQNDLYLNASVPDDVRFDRISSLGGTLQTVAFGDIDGDGAIDLVTAGYNVRPAVYRNLDGGLQPFQELVREFVTSLALADLDRDGDLDLVTASPTETDRIYRNDLGIFVPILSFGGRSRCVAVGDLDGDGTMEILTGNEGRPNVLFRFADGVLSAGEEFGPSGTTYCLALGDLDGDDDLDIVAANNGSRNLVHRVSGGSVDLTRAFGEDGQQTRGLALADLDGDADLDLVVANSRMASTAYSNDGLGYFADEPEWNAQSAQRANGVALADVDRDGDADLIFAVDGENLLYLNERPPFDPIPDPAWDPPAADTRRLRLADLDLDGDLDLVAGNRGRSTIFLNDGADLSPIPSAWNPPEALTNDVAIGDLDGDGAPDLVFGNGAEDSTGLFPQACTIFHNRVREAGGFFPFNNVPNGATAPVEATRGVALGDVNGDGLPDLATANGEFFESRTHLYLNRPGSYFSTPAWTAPIVTYGSAVAIADIDGDGLGDLITATGNDYQGGFNSLFLNGGDLFAGAPRVVPAESAISLDVAAADLEGDGDPDVVFAAAPMSLPASPGRDPVYRNTGGFLAETARLEDDFTRQVILADVDGDGDPDLVSANDSTSPSKIYRNVGGNLQTTAAWRSSEIQPTSTAAVGDVDGDGDPDLLFGHRTSPVTLHRGLRAAPARRLPDNPPSLRVVRIRQAPEENRIAVTFRSTDPESDPVWVIPEYRPADETVWKPFLDFDVAGRAGRLGPFPSSAAGSENEFELDVTPLPVRSPGTFLRLLIIPLPQRVSLGSAPLAFYRDMGAITPRRPEIAVRSEDLMIPDVAWGDSAVVDFTVENRGNRPLAIDSIDVPSGFHVAAPEPIAPGQTITLSLLFAPTKELTASGFLILHSNDPLRPDAGFLTQGVVRPLRITTRVIADSPGPVPLGKELGLLVTPQGGSRIGTGVVHYRPIGAKTFSDSLELVPTSESDRSQPFVAIFPADGVTEAGIEYQVSVRNGTVAVIDTLRSIDVRSPAQLETQAIPDSSGLRILAALPPGGLFESGTLYYRRGGAATGDSLPLARMEAGTGEATIAAKDIGVRGIEYRVRVRTAGGASIEDPDDGSFHFAPVEIRSLKDPDRYPARRYHLVSFPAETSAGIAFALQDDLGSLEKSRWRMFSWDSDSLTYHEAGLDSVLKTGCGYWLIASTSHTIDLEPGRGTSTPTDHSFRVRLKPGQNLIANPYFFPVSWNSVIAESAAPDSIERPQGYTPGDGYQPDSLLLPFRAYWVKNTGQDPLMLRIPPREFLEAGPTEKPASRVDRHSLNIRLDVISGDAADRFNIAGIAGAGREDWDPLDLSKPPPPPGGAPELYFPHRDWAVHPDDYSRDIRDAATVLDEGGAWRFDVAGPGSEPVGARLEISVTGDRPEGRRLFLIDHDLDRRIEPGMNGATYAFLLRPHARVAESAARFELRLEVDGAGNEPALPRVSRLLPPSPNPFRSRAVIRFELARKGPAMLSIFDVSGRRIREFEPEIREPGRYEVLWDGLTTGGSAAVPGVYFVSLSTGGSRMTAKIIRSR